MGMKPSQPPADGPAKVLRRTGAAALGAFSFAQFPGGPRPPVPPKGAEDARIAELSHKLRLAEEAHRQAMDAQKAERIFLEQEAFEKGFAEGKAQAEKAARKRYDEGLAQLRGQVAEALRQMDAHSGRQALEMEGLAVDLAGQAIAQALGSLPEFSPEAVLHALRACAQALGKSQSIVVKVHPEEVQTAEGEKEFWLGIDSDGERVKISPDARIPRGACHLESDFTSATLEWGELARRLAEALATAHGLRRAQAGLPEKPVSNRRAAASSEPSPPPMPVSAAVTPTPGQGAPIPPLQTKAEPSPPTDEGRADWRQVEEKPSSSARGSKPDEGDGHD